MREHSYAQATALAAVHTGPGEKDRALEWLERAFEEHCGGLVWVRHDPIWDGLREEPRFQALLSKMTWWIESGSCADSGDHSSFITRTSGAKHGSARRGSTLRRPRHSAGPVDDVHSLTYTVFMKNIT